MRWFLYNELGEDSPTLISSQNILDNYKRRRDFKHLSDEQKIDEFIVTNWAWEIEYDGEGPINPRWLHGTRMCPFYKDCDYAESCPRPATPDEIHAGCELFETRPRCHSKLRMSDFVDGRLNSYFKMP